MDLFSLNDQLIQLTGLTDEVTEAFVNDATVEVTIQRDGQDVEGETWPLSMPYVSSSDGVYRAVLESTIGISDGDKVTIFVEVTTPLGGNARFTAIETVQPRPFLENGFVQD